MKKSFQLLPFVFPAAFLFSLWGGQVFPGIEDDAFFYCRIADNFVSRGVMSFDGITATSGFHPMWMMLLSGMRLLVTGQYPFILAVVVLSTLLMGFSGYLFLSASRKYSPTVVLLLFILLARYIRDFSIMSMETSVLLPLAFLLLMRLDSSKASSGKGLWWAGILAGLMFLARLDSLLLSVPVLVLLVKKAGKRGLVPLLLPGLVLGIAYVSMNMVYMGTPFSVSGMMKASGPGWNYLFAGQLFRMSDPLGFFSPWGLYLVFLALSLLVLSMKEKPPSASAASVLIIVFTLVQLFMSRWRLHEN